MKYGTEYGTLRHKNSLIINWLGCFPFFRFLGRFFSPHRCVADPYFWRLKRK